MLPDETLIHRIELYKQAVMDCAKFLPDDYLDNRYREISMSHVLAQLVRHNVWAVTADDRDGVDLMFPDETDAITMDKIKKSGSDIASLILNPSPAPIKDSLTEISATVLLCCRLLVDKISTDLTTFNERVALANGIAHLMGETMLHMIATLPANEPSSMV